MRTMRWLLPLLLLLQLPLQLRANTSTLQGTFADASGNPLNGYLILQLPVPAMDTLTSTAIAVTPVTYRIVNGILQPGPPVFDVAGLQPQNLYYAARVYDNSGALVYTANYVITGTPFNFSAAIPTNVTTSNISFTNPLTANNTFTGTNNFNGALFSNNLTTGNVANKPALADAIIYLSASGNDANDGLSWGTAKLTPQASYNALPSTGGWVFAGCGTFSFSTGITFAVNNKPIKLVGSGPCTSFQYTGATGTAMLLDTGGGNPSQPSLLQDFNLITTVSGSTATGLQVGAGNTAKGTVISRIRITGFQVLANANAFGIYWEYMDFNTCSSAANTKALLVSSLQDDSYFFGGQMSSCGTIVDLTTGNNGPIRFTGTEFFASSPSTTIVSGGSSNIIYCVQCHLVNEGTAGTPTFLVAATNFNADFSSSFWEDDTTAASFTSMAQISGSSVLNMTNTRITGSGSTITGEAILLAGTSQLNWTNGVYGGFAGGAPLYNLAYTGGFVTLLGQLVSPNTAAQVPNLKVSAITNGTGLQLFNTSTTCTTAATINTPCTTAAITLPLAYSDVFYRVSCQGLTPTNFPQLQTVTKSNTSFTITLNNLTAAAATYGSFDCSVVHN